jgi:N-terminal domain of toast_rack, DUF2154
MKHAQSVHTILRIGAGELNLTGEADALMEGDFSYNVADWKPAVAYDVSGFSAQGEEPKSNTAQVECIFEFVASEGSPCGVRTVTSGQPPRGKHN